MALLPTVPTFASNDSSLANLQSLAYAVQFLSDNDVRPVWHLYKTHNFLPLANQWVTVPFQGIAFDSDSVSDGTGAVVQTQGYYAVETCLQLNTGGAAIGWWTQFLVTAGPFNPNHASGTQVVCGFKSGSAVSTANVDMALCSMDVVPWALYPDDSIYVQVYTTSSVTVDNNVNTAFMEARFVPNFTGMWLREGP